MKISKVTITGADNSIEPEQLLAIQTKYPFVEWGILFSKSRMATPRYPSYNWFLKLVEFKTIYPETKLSGHICGRWVRDICEGNWTILEDLPLMSSIFERFQLNFHSYIHKINTSAFLEGLKKQKQEIIFQLDNVNNSLLELAKSHGIKASGLFDTSGGAGIVPDAWPESQEWIGYSGGLNPDCLEAQLDEIEKVAFGTIWIDVETKVRTFDERLDLDKVEKFLEIASKRI
jgi:hypothetical protein